jgi:trigger factor
MQVTVEDISSVKKTLRIEIPQKDVAREVEKAYRDLKKSSKIKGFRPGKVPRSVLEKMFRKDVLADVSSRLIQSSFVDAVREKELRIVGTPKLDSPELNAERPYQYEATVEITPQIADVNFKGLSLKRSNYAVSDQEVDTQLKMLRQNLAQLQKITPERPAREGDHLLIDFEGFKDGKPFAETQKTENYTLKVGGGSVLKDFDDQLIGAAPGETREFPLTFPQDYANKALAGQTITFKVALKEIREEILPEIDDELAKRAGGRFETLEDLKREIAANLTQGYQKRAEHELNEQVFSSLLERAPFEVPEALVDMELEGILEEAEQSFAHRNTSMEQMGLSRETVVERYRETALNMVKRHLILNKIIEQEKLELTDAELKEAIQAMAENFKQSAEAIEGYYRENPEKLSHYKHALLEKKALKMILESSRIEELEPAAPAPFAA